MTDKLSFQHIGLTGYTVGALHLESSGMQWTDRSNTITKSFDGTSITQALWTVYGTKGHLRLYLNDGNFAIFDGFSKEDRNNLSSAMNEYYKIQLQESDPACDGGNFGDIDLDGNRMTFKSAKTGKQVFELGLHNVSQCVLPRNNKDEVEIQFHESGTVDKEEDMLVHVRLRFPTIENVGTESGDDEDSTPAEQFQKKIMERGMVKSITGNVIAEFTSEQGTFVTPRGKYTVQMYSTFMRMHGAKYDHKILYKDIERLFLLKRPDAVSAAVVIALTKPIRQGNQKYPHLVLQTHRMEYTLSINLSEEEIQEKYDGQLSPEMTLPMCNIFAKVFKVLSQSKVFISKDYKSARDDECVKCSHKANDGLLYPLTKLMIFINKPTALIQYSDIEYCEFQRYIPNAHSATKNFDLFVKLKPTATVYGDIKEYTFSGIERPEYAQLNAFLSSRKLDIRSDDNGAGDMSLLEQLGGMEEESEEDDDYESEESSDSGSESDEDDAVIVEEEGIPLKKKNRDKRGRSEKTSKRKSESSGVDTASPAPEGRKKARKDPNLPKGARSAYTYFLEELNPTLKAENPDASFGDISKLAGEKWKAMSAEEKEKYEALASSDKDRYAQEMAEYTPADGYGDDGKALGSTGGSKVTKRKREKDKNAPKGASSAYIIFSTKNRQAIKDENPEMTNTDIVKETGARWRAMTAEEKAPYEELSQADRSRYESEMEAYKQKKSEAADSDAEGGDDDDEPMDESDAED